MDLAGTQCERGRLHGWQVGRGQVNSVAVRAAVLEAVTVLDQLHDLLHGHEAMHDTSRQPLLVMTTRAQGIPQPVGVIRDLQSNQSSDAAICADEQRCVAVLRIPSGGIDDRDDPHDQQGDGAEHLNEQSKHVGTDGLVLLQLLAGLIALSQDRHRVEDQRHNQSRPQDDVCGSVANEAQADPDDIGQDQEQSDAVLASGVVHHAETHLE